jgi:uncharacterized integral membrane protein
LSEDRIAPSTNPIARWWRVGLGAVLVLVFVVFVAVNSQEVSVDLVIDEYEMRLAFALLIAGGLGFLTGLFVGWRWLRR